MTCGSSVAHAVMRGEAYASSDERLAQENARLRVAGCILAERASHVIREFDGLHRLAVAVSEWYATVASEFGRPEKP